MPTPYEEILTALNSENVDYIVVGGLAVVLHGHLRTTADVDIVISLETANVLSTVKALKGLGFRPRPPVPFEDFADAKKRQEWIDTKGLTVFSSYSPRYPGIEVDLFVQEPFNYERAKENAVTVQLDHAIVAVASIDDLIAMKQKAGRPLDLADIKALQSLKKS